jgi:DNA polymerase III delta prime subunit
MNITTRKSIQKIFSFVSERVTDENQFVNLNELAAFNLLDCSKTSDLKLLFRLRIQQKIELTRNKRNPEEFWLKLASKKVSVESDLTIFLALYGFFWDLSPSKSWKRFDELTEGKFTNMKLVQIIKKHRLSNLETKVLLHTIEGFLKGQHPAFLNDIHKHPNELIYATVELLNENNKLIKNELVNVQIDQDGVSVRTTLTPLSLAALANQDGKKNFGKQSKNGLFEYISHEKILPNPLYYDSLSGAEFSNFCDLSKKINKQESLTILLHGKPGTGKTAFAHQLTKEIGGTMLQLNFAQIQSKWVGETEKNIRTVFNTYAEKWHKSKEPVVLLINEADGLMNKRVKIHTSIDAFSNHAQTELLEQLENFKGILIATTNLMENIDSAFYRRFLFSTEVTPPSNEIRSEYLLNSSLQRILSKTQLRLLEASNWTIAEIKNVERKIDLLSRVKVLSENELDYLLKDSGVLMNSQASEIGFRMR